MMNRCKRILLAVAWVATLSHGRETKEEAAMLARELLVSSPKPIATMATIYPNDHAMLPGQPYAMQEYYAPCYSNGSLALIFLPISRHSQNILHSPSHSASISVWSDPPAAARARVSLIGNVTILPDDDPDVERLKQCYLSQHPDAQDWIPGDDEGAHLVRLSRISCALSGGLGLDTGMKAYWARFDPHSVYFVGGFGDEHLIGYLPLELYQSAVPSSATLMIQNDS